MACLINPIAEWSTALDAIQLSMEDMEKTIGNFNDTTESTVDDVKNDTENSAEIPADNTAEDKDANETRHEDSTCPPPKPERNSDTDFVLMRQNTKSTATQSPPTKRPAPTSADTSPKRHKANEVCRDGLDKPDEPGNSSGPKETAQPENMRQGDDNSVAKESVDIPDTCYNMGYSMGRLALARADMEVHIDETIMRQLRVTEKYNEALGDFSWIYSELTPIEREGVNAGWQNLFPGTDPPTVEASKPENWENLNEEDDENENVES